MPSYSQSRKLVPPSCAPPFLKLRSTTLVPFPATIAIGYSLFVSDPGRRELIADQACAARSLFMAHSTEEQHREQILDQFTRQAEPFARAMRSDRESLRLLMESTRASNRDLALDLACGPGLVTCALASAVGHVIGIDLVPAMLDQARKRQAEMHLENIEWRLGDVTHLPFDDAAFSLVVTRYSFHHFLEPRAVLREMARFCRPGGRVAVADATPDEGKAAAYDELETLRDPSHTRALPLDELKSLAEGLPLRLLSTTAYRLDASLEAVLAASFPPPGHADRIRQMVRDDLGADHFSMAPYIQDGELRFSFPTSVVVWEKA
jgi:SAM-dependent methyltransferase